MRTKQQRKFEREDLYILAYKLEASFSAMFKYGLPKKKNKKKKSKLLLLY